MSYGSPGKPATTAAFSVYAVFELTGDYRTTRANLAFRRRACDAVEAALDLCERRGWRHSSGPPGGRDFDRQVMLDVGGDLADAARIVPELARVLAPAARVSGACFGPVTPEERAAFAALRLAHGIREP